MRKYELKTRKERQAETHRRITEAAVELHRTLGPAQTTISAVADRAGVERLTVYRHFGDESGLFAACTSHWLTLHPPPEPDLAGDTVEVRLRSALDAFYRYYEETEDMTERVLRDAALVPAMLPHLEEFEHELRLLAAAVAGKGATRLARAAVGHALDFTTWRSLVRGQALSRAQVVDLMVRLVGGSVRSRRP